MFSFALGVGSQDAAGNWLEVYYPRPLFQPSDEDLQPIVSVLGYQGGNQALAIAPGQIKHILDQSVSRQADAGVALLSQFTTTDQALVATFIETDEKPVSVPEAYLKLHLLSHRLVKPHTLNLDGLFALLPNVAWTNQGPIALAALPQRQLAARLKGELLDVMSVDKFPKMSDYVVPAGVRIADTARVRLGAYIGEGSTIMHEGFVNFNAGSEGNAMVEGRISAGVFVGTGSDLGGGCSIMGTLSGGGTEVIAIGRNCLIGANAGLGISLGDHCTVEAGLYVTAGTKVAVLDIEGKAIGTMKARDLSGRDNLLFRRNSTTGIVECLTKKSRIQLNSELHAHN